MWRPSMILRSTQALMSSQVLELAQNRSAILAFQHGMTVRRRGCKVNFLPTKPN